jgi:hypothetical protein
LGIAGDLQGLPVRVRAPHFRDGWIVNLLRMGLFLKFARILPPPDCAA